MCSVEADSLHKQLLRSFSGKAAKSEEELVSATETITKLFEHIAALVEEQSPIVEERFGPGSTVTMLKNLQIQSDIQATKIIDVFCDHFMVFKTLDEVSKRKSGQIVDPRQVAYLLEEIALMSQSTELYDRFLRNKAKVYLQHNITLISAVIF
jgi:chromosomal replication initiation ATPase DnaA